jgi:hypothetical protein
VASSKVYDDILGLARKESAHAGHFYIGVEHLFIALTKLENGVTVNVLEGQGVAPRFVRYMIRQELGQGDNRRFWPGFRETPRLHAVLRAAQAIAEEKKRTHPDERDLLVAILREGDSLPYRVMQNMDVDLDRLEVETSNWSAQMRMQPVKVPIEPREGVDLNPDEEAVLQHMFRGYERVVIERPLRGGYSSAKVLVAAPYRTDGFVTAPVVVKLDERQAILYEKMRYDSYVRDTLPPATARVLDNPVVPDRLSLGGLKYTFIRDPEATGPVDLAAYANEHGPAALVDLLWNSLFRVFGETWWLQRHLYQFGVWQEYEMILPPALVVEVSDSIPTPRRRLTPMGHWSRRGRFAHREVVALEGFTVEDFYPDRDGIQLVSGAGPEAQNRAGKVEVRGIPLPSKEYYRGAVVERLVGRVIHTRDDLLYNYVEQLEPDFDLLQDRLPAHPAFGSQLPNPLKRYVNLLQRRLAGSLSTIHGDLHLHNVLVGPGGNAWLIDFAQTREGHTLFDWAVLEASLLTEVVAPYIDTDSWDDIWPVIKMLADLGQTGKAPPGRLPVERSLQAIEAVRGIAGQCLADPDDWREYYVALALCAMRGLRWTRTISLKGRRLLFLVSALAMSAASVKEGFTAAPDTDATDVNLEVTDIMSSQEVQRALGSSRPAVLPRASSSSERGVDATEDGASVGLRFSAFHAKEIAANEWHPLHVYAYRGYAAGLVTKDAHSADGDLPQAMYAQPAKPEWSSISENLQIMATPHIPGFQFNPMQASVLFLEDWHRIDFRMRAVDALATRPYTGSVTLSIGGVIVADIPLTVMVSHSSSLDLGFSAVAKPYEAIYCSYSLQDSTVVQQIEHVSELLGLDYLHELTRLRSELTWNEALRQKLEDADIFQLFWSDQAATAQYVEQEWRYALRMAHKPAFLRPVYWQQPLKLPPSELEHLNFAYHPEILSG